MATDCISEDTMALFAAGTLEHAQRPTVEAHLDLCDECRRGIAALIAGSSQAKLVTSSLLDAHVTLDRHAFRPVPTKFRPGDRVGRYVVTRQLGHGGMGVVLAARDPELDRDVAIKLVSPRVWRDASDGSRDLLRQEARAMARIVDPHVVAVHDIGTVDDQLFVAMELVDGGGLDSWLKAQPRSWRDILAVCVAAGRGIAAVHAAGLVHRDVKPSNVMVDRGGRVRIGDFGLAVLARSDDSMKHTAGTPAYMSPEQHAGAVIGAASDQFSFCVMTYEALYGERPFASSEINRMADQKATNELRPPPAKTAVPSRIRNVLLRGMNPDPNKRFANMTALLARLAPSPLRRHRAIAVAIGVALPTLAAAVMLPGNAIDSCATGDARLTATWSSLTSRRAAAGLRGPHAEALIATLDRDARTWRDVHRATCRSAGETRRASIDACLDARRIELASVAEDLTSGAVRTVSEVEKLVRATVRDPAACRDPVPGLLEPASPRDRAMRSIVTGIRYRLLELRQDDRRNRALLDAAQRTVAEAERVGWLPLAAEAQLTFGKIAMSVDDKAAVAALKRATTVAELAHHDRAAAEAWLELATIAAFDHGELDRALEYVDSARAAAIRIAAPADLEAQIASTRGFARVVNGEVATGTRDLEAALAIAQQRAPEQINTITLGLAEAYKQQGRPGDAVAMFRQALDRELALGGSRRRELALHSGLAGALSMLGKHDEAIAEGKRAVELAERDIGEDQIDRGVPQVTLAEIYSFAGRPEEALAMTERAETSIVASVGKRSSRYGELLELRAGVLLDLGRVKQSAAMMKQACEIVAFTSGERSVTHEECLLDSVQALQQLGLASEAQRRIEQALPIVSEAYGDDHVRVARAYIDLGESSLELGERSAALEAYEQARKRLDGKTGGFERGLLGAAEWGISRAIDRDDPSRAAALAGQAIERWGSDPNWARTKKDATRWLASRRKSSRTTRSGTGTGTG